MRKLLVGLALSGIAWGSGEVLGRIRLVDMAPKTASVIQTATGTGPVTVTTTGAHGLATGCTVGGVSGQLCTAVYIYEPMTQDAFAASRGRMEKGGLYNITITDGTHFTLNSEMLTGVTSNFLNGIAVGFKVVPVNTYFVRQGPKIWRDGPINKGAWDSAANYRTFEMVSSGGNSYMAIADNTNQVPPNASYWKQVDPSLVGPGTFSAALRDPTRVNASNTAWTMLNSNFTANCSAYGTAWNQTLYQQSGWCAAAAAWIYFASGDATARTYALNLLQEAEDMGMGGNYCDTRVGFCGIYDSGGTFDVNRTDAWPYVAALETVWDLLSTSQQQTLANKLLGGRDLTHNGWDNTQCTEPVLVQGAFSVADQISVSRYVVTGTGFLSKPGLTAGARIYGYPVGPTGTYIQVIGRVKSVDSDTQLTLEPCLKNSCRAYGTSVGSPPVYYPLLFGYVTGNQPGTSTPGASNPWYYVKAWDDADHYCGYAWWLMHHPSTARMIVSQTGTFATDYSVSRDDWPKNNRTYTNIATHFMIGMITANLDIRGVRLAEQAGNYFMAMQLPNDIKSTWALGEGHGFQYGLGRVQSTTTDVALSMARGLTTTPPGVVTGNWLGNIMKWDNWAPMLARPTWLQPWDVAYSSMSDNAQSVQEGIRIIVASNGYLKPGYLTSEPDYAAYSRDYFKNRRYDFGLNDWGALAVIPKLFVWWDPTATFKSISNEPPQLLLAGGQTDQEECIASGLWCQADTPHAGAYSYTGWTNMDTQLAIHAQSAVTVYLETGYGQGGDLTIVQNNGPGVSPQSPASGTTGFLLGGNGLPDKGFGSSYAGIGGYGSDGSQIMINNGTSDLYGLNQWVALDRWAGATPKGVSDSSYVYARVNLTPAVRNPEADYLTTTRKGSKFATAVGAACGGCRDITREVIHFKNGTGARNYVVDYDQGQYTQANQFRSYWQLMDGIGTKTNNRTNMQIRHSEWVNYTPATKTAILTHPELGRLTVQALPVAGASGASTVALGTTTTGVAQAAVAITAISWSGGVVTLTTTASPWGLDALPTDGTAIITIAGVAPSGYNGSFPVTAYSSVGAVRTLSYDLASDPGAATTLGTIRMPTWCSYISTHNAEGSCKGAYITNNEHAGSASSIYPIPYRVHTCPSDDGLTCKNVTDAEQITVLQVSNSGTETMPTLTQPTCTGVGADCTAVQIEDSLYPSVAIMARKGGTMTQAAITSTHAGTAKYVVTGLAAGAYDITVGGNPVATGLVVTTSDSTLKFNSTAGVISIANSGAPVGLLILDKSQLNFTCLSDGTASSPQTIGISASGVTLDQWTATDNMTWLSLAPGSGVAAGSTTATLNCSGATSGTGTITVSSSTTGISNSPQTVGVSLTVYAAPSITSTSPLASGLVGQPYGPIQLTAINGKPFYSWSISSGTLCNGLNLSPSGVIDGTPTTVQDCDFTVQMTDSQPVTVTKGFRISVTGGTPSIALNVSPGTLGFTCTAGGSSAAQTVTFSSSGGTLDQWTASAAAGDNWVGIVPNTGTTASNFDVTANCGALSAGTYNSLITVSSSTAGVTNSPTIQVSVVVSAAATVPVTILQVGATEVKFKYTAGDGNEICVSSVGSVNAFDNGGPKVRFGFLSGAVEGALQDLTVTCGSAVGRISFRTGSSVGEATTIALERTAPPAIGAVAKMKVSYGQTIALGSTQTVACTGFCSTTIPANLRKATYFKVEFLTAGDASLYTSAIDTYIP